MDDCVVDEYWNLVGVVAEVGENWATVRTLVDSDTEMAASSPVPAARPSWRETLPSWGRAGSS